MGKVQIEWVMENGKIKHVSEYGHLLPEERPRVLCSECGQNLDLKLGKENAWHAAHVSGSTTCVLSDSETALHYQ